MESDRPSLRQRGGNCALAEQGTRRHYLMRTERTASLPSEYFHKTEPATRDAKKIKKTKTESFDYGDVTSGFSDTFAIDEPCCLHEYEDPDSVLGQAISSRPILLRQGARDPRLDVLSRFSTSQELLGSIRNPKCINNNPRRQRHRTYSSSGRKENEISRPNERRFSASVPVIEKTELLTSDLTWIGGAGTILESVCCSVDGDKTIRFPENKDCLPARTEDFVKIEEENFPLMKGDGRKADAAEALRTGSPSGSCAIREQIMALFQVSDNKLSMKLFGNKSAVMKEKLRQKAAGNWVIHPCSTFRLYWDLCMLVLLLANLIILPIGISFFNDDLSLRWIIFNSISDTLFLLDLAINFRTGILKDNFADEIILDPKLIAKNYLKSWFVLDLISSLPLDYLTRLISPDGGPTQLLHAGRALKMFRLVKLLSLLRLLRLSRLVRYVGQWEEFISSAAGKFMRIFNLISMMLLLGHWNGCLQFLVPMLQDFPSDSWVSIEELQDADWSEQYTWALFKALSHMLSIGFGRYAPQSTTDVWLTMVSMLTGATCYALFVGNTTTLIQSFDTSRRMYNEKLKQVEEYTISRKLPRQLRQRISDYYEHRYHGKMFDEESILGELNDCLREEIVNFNCRSLVSSVPFFFKADDQFVGDVVTRLHFEVYQPGDVIIKEGTVGDRMYFIQAGAVDIIDSNGNVKATLEDGSYFGEICLLMRAKRVASVRAVSYCSLFSLTVDHLTAILNLYPEVKKSMEAVAIERLRQLGRIEDGNLTQEVIPESE